MNFPALANRELLARSRHWATYRNRTLAALVGVGVVTVMLIIAEVFGSMQTIGASMFTTLSWLAFLFALFEGLRNTVDCLSSEKREGTLGLLLLTELTPLDVVLGKLAVNSISAFYSLLAAFPALAMPFVLGGVTAGEFWRMLLALLNALFFSLAAGMLVSSGGRDERRVWTAGLGLIGLLTVGLPVLDLLLAGGDPAKVSALFGLVSPAIAFSASADTVYSLTPGVFWSAFGFTHLTAWLMLVFSGVRLSRNWNDTEVRPPGRLERWMRRWFSGPLGAPSLTPLRAQNPVYWLSRLNSQPRLMYVILAAAFGLSLLLMLIQRGSPEAALPVVVIFWVLHWFLRIWMAAQACNAMAAYRDSGMLELTLVSPVNLKPRFNDLNPGGIPNAMARALQDSYLGPLFWLAAAEFSLLLLGIFQQAQHANDGVIFLMLGWLVALAILWLDLNAVIYTGLWYGLTARKATTAITRTVVHVLVLPLLLVVLVPVCLFFCGFGIPFLFMGKASMFSNRMRDRLNQRLQIVASEPAAPDLQPPWWWPFGCERRKPAPLPALPRAVPPADAVRCVSCFALIARGSTKCPHCGWTQPR